MLSIAMIGVLVYAVIEAPVHGWRSTSTLSLGAAATLFALAFVLWERTRRTPMLDVRLFLNIRFSTACLSVTVAWFSLFGFIILITQYFQYFKRFDPLTYGMALAPIATSIAVGSVLGILLAMRFGGRWVVASGLGLMAVFFLWVSTVSSSTDYWPTIVGQMIVGGLGLGLTTAPATETIMDVVPVEKSAVGSAMNDATRELGGTLGVAVAGSIFASAYAANLTDAQAAASLPAEALATAKESVGAALAMGLSDPTGALSAAVDNAFYAGLQPACLITGFVALAGALLAAVFLPSKRRTAEAQALAFAGEAATEHTSEASSAAHPSVPVARLVPVPHVLEHPNAF